MNTLQTMYLYTAILATSLLVSSVSSKAFCEYDGKNKCPLAGLPATNANGSIKIYPGGDTRCAFNDYQSDRTGFSSNKTYFFQVFPNQSGFKKKLLINFEGGGACVDDLTCSFALQCSNPPGLFTHNATTTYTGILNRSKSDNVFSDWNVVHLPYCTGDLHVGNRIREASVPEEIGAFGIDTCLTTSEPLYHNGYNNSIAALQWAAENFADPDEIVLAGESAGSLGAQLLSAYVGDLWNIKEKPIKFSLLLDSYVGVLPPGHTGGEILGLYDACSVDLKMDQAYVDSCEDGSASVVDLVEPLLKNLYPYQWLFINSNGDATQRYFYELVDSGVTDILTDTVLDAGGITLFDDDLIVSPETFNSSMREMLDQYKSYSDLVSTFFVEGETHVFTRRNNYTDYTGTNGKTLGKYLSSWLANATSAANSPQEPKSSSSDNFGSSSQDNDAATTVLPSISLLLLAFFLSN